MCSSVVVGYVRLFLRFYRYSLTDLEGWYAELALVPSSHG